MKLSSWRVTSGDVVWSADPKRPRKPADQNLTVESQDLSASGAAEQSATCRLTERRQPAEVQVAVTGHISCWGGLGP